MFLGNSTQPDQHDKVAEESEITLVVCASLALLSVVLAVIYFSASYLYPKVVRAFNSWRRGGDYEDLLDDVDGREQGPSDEEYARADEAVRPVLMRGESSRISLQVKKFHMWEFYSFFGVVLAGRGFQHVRRAAPAVGERPRRVGHVGAFHGPRRVLH